MVGVTTTLSDRAAPPAGGAADVVYVLLLLQAAFGLLAVLGMVLIMGGNPAYAVVPLVKPVLLMVLAGALVRGRRWARGGVIAIELLSLGSYSVNLLLGFLPELDITVNLVTVLTNCALPMAVIWLCAGIRRPQPWAPSPAEAVR